MFNYCVNTCVNSQSVAGEGRKRRGVITQYICQITLCCKVKGKEEVITGSRKDQVLLPFRMGLTYN